MKRISGFTIAELMVVIIVIGILTAISVVAYDRVEADARDASRESTIAVIQDGLERYYRTNGEYPSVPQITGSRNAAKDVLDVQEDQLTMPRLPEWRDNPLVNWGNPDNDTIVYSGTGSTCTSTSGGCTTYTLRYNQEQGGETTVQSRY